MSKIDGEQAFARVRLDLQAFAMLGDLQAQLGDKLAQTLSADVDAMLLKQPLDRASLSRCRHLLANSLA